VAGGVDPDVLAVLEDEAVRPQPQVRLLDAVGLIESALGDVACLQVLWPCRFGWSGPYGEEFAPDPSASVRIRFSAELLAILVSGSLRRNVLGAIASEKNDGDFP
jgi:hypothetical protein